MLRDDATQGWLPAVPLGGDHDRRYHTVTPPGWDLAAFWRLLMRRRRLILTTVVLLTTCSTVVIFLLPPRYDADALLLVREHQPTLLDIQKAVRGTDSDTSDSEIEILRSRRIAKLVVNKLDLIHEPLVNPALQPEGWFSHALYAAAEPLRPVWAWIGDHLPKTAQPQTSVLAASGPAPTPLTQEEIAVNRTADVLMKHLTVAAKGRSRAVGVSYESPDPRLAAAVANAVVESYVNDQLDTKMRASAQANNWLAQRVAEIRAQVVSADHVLQRRKVEAGITDGRQVSLIQEQISDLSTHLIAARADKIRAEARLRQATQTRTAEAVNEILNSPVVQKLREDQMDLQHRYAAAREMYGDKYPPVQKLQLELTALNGSVQREIGVVVSAMRSDVEALRQREDALLGSLDDLKARSARIGDIDVDIAVQQREADANRALFDRILSRAKEANIEIGLQQADGEIIAHADMPEKAAFPNKPLFISVAFLTALAAAGLIVVAVESLDQGFHDLEEAEDVLGIPALGFIPRLPRRAGLAPHVYALQRPLSPYAEAVRGLYTSLSLCESDHVPKRLLVTSSLPGEGKTSLSVSLACLMASAGRKVILLDCDLRRRDVSRMVGLPAEPGLVDYLTGKVDLASAIVYDPSSGAAILPAGSRAANPPDLLGSQKMRDLLTLLGETYDLVIMDSAPVLAISDTRSLCRFADKVVLAVHWQQTRRAAVIPAVKQIAASGGALIGFLLTLADTKRLPSYSSGAYYVGAVQRYLTQ